MSEPKLLEHKIVEIVENSERRFTVDYWEEEVREDTWFRRDALTNKIIGSRIMRYSFDYLTATDSW